MPLKYFLNFLLFTFMIKAFISELLLFFRFIVAHFEVLDDIFVFLYMSRSFCYALTFLKKCFSAVYSFISPYYFLWYSITIFYQLFISKCCQCCIFQEGVMGLYNEISASFICPFVSVLLISIIFPIQSSINLGWILPLSCRCFFQLELRYLAANILGNLRNHQVPGLSELSCFLSARPPAISDVIWVWSV